MTMAASDTALSADQAAVYDRQLRVWGVEVQRKLTASRVLLLGFGQLAAEVAKNITLAGVGSVTLACDDPASQFAGRNFLITCPPAAGATAAQAAASALQAMNPLVQVAAAPGSIQEASSANQLRQFDLVVAAGLPLLQVKQLDDSCAQAGTAFMAAAAPGPGGYFFLNLHQHSYIPKKPAGDASPPAAAAAAAGAITQPQTLSYPSFSSAMSVDVRTKPASSHPLYLVMQVALQQEQALGRPLAAADTAAANKALSAAAAAAGREVKPAHQQLMDAMVHGAAEFAPVCAVLGGVVANNIIQAVSHSGAPLKNLFYYSLFDGQQGLVEDLPPANSGKAAAAAGSSGQGAQAAAHEVLEID